MLTIGVFSMLSRVSARMLRHYDSLGLLRPELVGENGYRYYRQEQLADLLRIRRLQDYGFPLSQIGALLTMDEASLLDCLRQRRREARTALAIQRVALRRLEEDILRMEGMTMSEYHVILLEDQEQRVFSLRRQIGVTSYHALFQDLRTEAAKRGLRQAGPIQMRYHDPEFSPKRSDVEAQMVVTGDSPDTAVKPAYTCAAVIHRGPYEGLARAYDALCAWLAAHTEYRLCAPPLERYLNSPHQVSSSEDLETAVLFPVAPAEEAG